MIKLKVEYYLFISLLFFNCEDQTGTPEVGLNSLVIVTDEPKGSNCEYGGIKIEVGTDSNSNGILDTKEVLSKNYICNGATGAVSLLKVVTESPGTNCQNGGIKVDSGVDINRDGTLNIIEITNTTFVCNGLVGKNSLIRLTSEPAGANCQKGGLRIDSGLDSNGDGVLNTSEISSIAYVCNGIDGKNSMTKTTNEPAGTNCQNGGFRIDSGVDINGDGLLVPTEIAATAYVCNGNDGKISLINITDEPDGVNCESGGVKIVSGLDNNGDMVLNSNEVTSTSYLCSQASTAAIVFDFNLSSASIYTTTTSVLSGAANTIQNFNLADYPGVVSVKFEALMSISGAANTVTLELYDFSNNQLIANSSISTTNNSEILVVSTLNFLADFPKGPFNLGFKLTSQNGGFAGMRNPKLRLLRN